MYTPQPVHLGDGSNMGAPQTTMIDYIPS